MIELLSELNQLRSVSKRWDRQYRNQFSNKKWKHISDQLRKLDPSTSSANDVTDIVGNRTWVCEAECDACGNESYESVLIGQDPDYESQTATVCIDCLKAAIQIIEGAKIHPTEAKE